MIGGKPRVEILKETAPLAMGIVAIGSCASWGGIPSADPSLTGAKGAQEVLGDKPDGAGNREKGDGKKAAPQGPPGRMPGVSANEETLHIGRNQSLSQ